MPVNRLQQTVVDAGDLRHLVEIQSRSTTSDSFGQQLATWQTVRTAWASVVPGAAPRQVYQAGQWTSQLTHTITVRWSPVAIAAGMRVLFGSRVFQIEAATNVLEMNALVELLCLEINATS